MSLEAESFRDGGSGQRIVKISNKRGLHARAAAKFVNCVAGFDAEILVSKDGTQVSGCSIMGLMMLAASKGTEIGLSASGPQAGEALDSLCLLIEGKFQED